MRRNDARPCVSPVQAELKEQHGAAAAAVSGAGAGPPGELLLRGADAYDEPLLLVDCGADGRWRLLFASPAAAEQAGERAEGL